MTLLAGRAIRRGLRLASAVMLSEILAVRQSWEVKLRRRGMCSAYAAFARPTSKARGIDRGETAMVRMSHIVRAT